MPADLGGITTKQIKASVKPFREKKGQSGQIGGSFSWSDFAIRLQPSAYKEIVTQTFQSLNYVNQLPQPSEEEISKKRLPLDQKKVLFRFANSTQPNKKTIIFDLDETLVHCTYHDADDSKTPDVTLPIPMDGGGSVEAGFNIRPFCADLLAFANQHFEVIVFTASHQNYADAILDHLDPTGTLIHHRLYRPSCVKTEEGVYIKDLRVVNRDLKDVALVDNAVFSFGFQLDNGVPIAAYREG